MPAPAVRRQFSENSMQRIIRTVRRDEHDPTQIGGKRRRRRPREDPGVESLVIRDRNPFLGPVDSGAYRGMPYEAVSIGSGTSAEKAAKRLAFLTTDAIPPEFLAVDPGQYNHTEDIPLQFEVHPHIETTGYETREGIPLQGGDYLGRRTGESATLTFFEPLTVPILHISARMCRQRFNQVTGCTEACYVWCPESAEAAYKMWVKYIAFLTTCENV